MRAPIRTQHDNKGDEYSEATALDLSATERLTRQEFKHESDPNEIMRRFTNGADVRGRAPTFGEVDYDIDLQQGFAAVANAQAMHAELPDALREKYPTWQHVLHAAQSGALEQDLHPEATANASTDQPIVPSSRPDGNGNGGEGSPKP